MFLPIVSVKVTAIIPKNSPQVTPCQVNQGNQQTDISEGRDIFFIRDVQMPAVWVELESLRLLNTEEST